MAERAKPRQKRTTAKKKSDDSSAALASAVEQLETKMRALKRERDSLRKELGLAKTRIKELEQANTQAVNRIDWVIDSLHNLLEDGE